MTAVTNYAGTTAPMSRFKDGAVLIPEGSDPGAVIMAHPILGSAIETVPMMCASFHPPYVQDVGDRQIVRVVDSKALGVVGKRYKGLKIASLAGLLTKLHKEFGLSFETAMLLENDTTFLTQASLRTFDLGPLASTQRAKLDTNGRDLVKGFMTFADNFVGKRNATVGAAHTRAVCENTAAAAIAESKESLYGKPIRHTGDVDLKLDQWHKAIEDSLQALARFEEFATCAAQTKVTHSDAQGLIDLLIPVPVDASPVKAQSKRDAIYAAFDNGIGNSGRTAWDLYNGVTEYANWSAPVRGADPHKARMESILWDGLGDLVQTAETHLRMYLSL